MKKIILLVISSFILSASYTQFDTAGIHSWPKLYNSMQTWDEGAFNVHSIGNLDYGWGVYNMRSHNVIGDSLHAIKLQDESWKNIFIQLKQSTKNIYTFSYRDMDGNNEIVENIDNSMNGSKLFTYYSLSDHKIVDREPDKSQWDLVLTKYHDNIINYDVTGILINENAKVSVYEASDSVSAFNAVPTEATVYSDSLTIIGNSWYKLSAMSIIPLDTIAYFIKTNENEVYRLNVTYFESGSSGQGRVGVLYQKLKPVEESPVKDTLTMGHSYANDVYFKLSNGTKNTASRASWDIAFKTTVMSASILANTTMGIELYTYPNIDATAWLPSGLKKEQQFSGIKLYPNPVIDLLTISSEDFRNGELIDIRIFNVLGKEVLSRNLKINAEIQLDLSTFSKGLYFVNIVSGSKKSVGKFIKAN